MNTELKPCPFCGGETEVKKSFDEEGKVIGHVETYLTSQKSKELNGPIFQVLVGCLDKVLEYDVDVDGAMGFELAFGNAPISVKLAFNTLINYGVLSEIEIE